MHRHGPLRWAEVLGGEHQFVLRLLAPLADLTTGREQDPVVDLDRGQRERDPDDHQTPMLMK